MNGTLESRTPKLRVDGKSLSNFEDVSEWEGDESEKVCGMGEIVGEKEKG